jgi:hypothetical protein
MAEMTPTGDNTLLRETTALREIGWFERFMGPENYRILTGLLKTPASIAGFILIGLFIIIAAAAPLIIPPTTPNDSDLTLQWYIDGPGDINQVQGVRKPVEPGDFLWRDAHEPFELVAQVVLAEAQSLAQRPNGQRSMLLRDLQDSILDQIQVMWGLRRAPHQKLLQESKPCLDGWCSL